MPIDEIAGGFLRILGRFITEFFIQLVFELLIKGPGYVITKLVSKSEPDVEGWRVAVCGILFWIALFGAVYLLHHNIGGSADTA